MPQFVPLALLGVIVAGFVAYVWWIGRRLPEA